MIEIGLHSIMDYPRPSGRGSIEALIRCVWYVSIGGYPRPSGRGSIEAE